MEARAGGADGEEQADAEPEPAIDGLRVGDRVGVGEVNAEPGGHCLRGEEPLESEEDEGRGLEAEDEGVAAMKSNVGFVAQG